MKKNSVAVLAMASLIAVTAVAGCGANRTLKGGALGAGAGGLLGAIIGKQSGNTAQGALIGAAVGGTAGALIGRRMDKQAAEMKAQLDGAQVERVGEGIKVTYASGILFQTNASTLSTEAKTNITKMAEILQKYPDTDILVEGHTDSDGSDSYNQTLSERRAQSVAQYVTSIGVTASRFKTAGYGESQPVASNDTAVGKQANRRVEIIITANEAMKQAAQNGTL